MFDCGTLTTQAFSCRHIHFVCFVSFCLFWFVKWQDFIYFTGWHPCLRRFLAWQLTYLLGIRQKIMAPGSQRVHHSVECLILFSLPKWYFNKKSTSLPLHGVHFLSSFLSSILLPWLRLFLYLIKTADLLQLNSHRHSQLSMLITKSIIFLPRHVFTMWWAARSQSPECQLSPLILLCFPHPDNSQVLPILLSRDPSSLSSAAYWLSIATSGTRHHHLLLDYLSPHIHTCGHVWQAFFLPTNTDSKV